MLTGIAHIRARITAFCMATIMAAALLGVMAQPTQAQVTLVEAGKSVAVIVLPDAPEPAEVTAARELADYIHRATGVQLETRPESQTTPNRPRLLVGRTGPAKALLSEAALADLGPDGFIQRLVGRDVVLVGGSSRGTLYAVYAFLEDQLGVRWFTAWGEEDVPVRDRWVVDELDSRSWPAFAVRDLYTHINMPRDVMHPFMVRNRMQGPQGRRVGRDMSAAYGGTSHQYIPSPPHMVHTLFWFISPDTYFADHPEYFSYQASSKARMARQLCFSNAEMKGIMTQKILDRLEQTGGVGNLSISAQDVSGPLCECPDCRALIQKEHANGAPLFQYLAEVGPVVAKRFPQAYLTTLAYRKDQTEVPPRHLKLPDNVIVIFAAIDDDFSKSLRHEANHTTYEHLRDWRMATDHLWVWYYPNPYSHAYPVGNLRRLHEDFQVFKEVGVEGFFIEQSAPGAVDGQRLSALQTWLIGRFMWEPDQDRHVLIRDFTDRFYGPAAEDIRQYIKLLEEDTWSMASVMSWNASLSQYRFLTADLLVEADRLLAAALARTQPGQTEHLRVRQVRLSVDLAIIHLWDQLGLDRHFPQGLAGLIGRYRDSYTASAKVVAPLPDRERFLLGRMNEQMDWLGRKTPLKPLPAPLSQVAADRVHQITPEQSSRSRNVPVLVEDATAAAGIAVEYEYDVAHPFEMGFYEAVSKRQFPAYVPEKDIVPGAYRLHRIGQVALSDHCYIWFTRTWMLQFPGVSAYFKSQQPQKQWEVWASVHFDEQTRETDDGKVMRKFRVDRLILIEQ